MSVLGLGRRRNVLVSLTDLFLHYDFPFCSEDTGNVPLPQLRIVPPRGVFFLGVTAWRTMDRTTGEKPDGDECLDQNRANGEGSV